MGTAGTVRDIRTGRALYETPNLTTTFIEYVTTLLKAEKDVFVVSGPCRHLEMRQMIDIFREQGVVAIIDRQMPPDRVYIFEGFPDELGFAS